MKEYVFKTNREIKSCANCPCKQIYRYTTECNLLFKETVHNGRLEDCPLVGLSEPHGDLIDRQAVVKALNKAWNVDDDSEFSNKSVWRIIEKEAPTVLEASE